jgi:hypothetical protein
MLIELRHDGRQIDFLQSATKAIPKQYLMGAFGVGHGFNFMLNNTHSIALELLVYKYFTMNQKFEARPQGNPNFNLNALGAKLAVFVNI